MRTILVVDDEPTLLDLLGDVLWDAGYTVVTASDGTAALQAVTRETPNLVLMDVMMPGLDGREAAKAMRAEANGAAIPIVLMSAAVNLAPLDAGVSGFLPKPFDLDELLNLVARLLDDPG